MAAGEDEAARRRYEELARRLAELDRVDGIDLGPRPRPRRRHRARRRWRHRGVGAAGSAAVAVLVLAGLVGGTGAWRDLLSPGASAGAPATAVPTHADEARAPEVLEPSTAWPPLPAEAAGSRLAPVVRAPGSGEHTFLGARPDGRPVGYDPCRPLRYVVNPSGMPAEGPRMVREAVAAVSDATGLVFVDEGTTTEPLTERRDARQPGRYGDRWAPVLVAWGDASSFPALAGDVAGVAGSVVLAPSGPGTERYVTGQVVLDRQDLGTILRHPGGYEMARAVVLHELAHLVGLGHVDDPASLMHETTTGQSVFSAGDLEGLAAVGGGPCFRDT